ncbi:PREDICTED: uncharacterized protein LOC106107273 isoform X2 [Papilio polytes]|uniref:uncharacterized protein LOC106107273 isoform X2 n=1 Tax=Papilio polytes TaxID=76194 RepID=UPI0006761F08|nr:PREDICTED: uncharacterized protein LOC106107273 isoform X2 [Papilio polytes]
MSDMIINDSVPVDKKWNELIKYNIFIMKLIEFVISMILLTLPFALPAPEIFHCLAAAPTLMLSFMFIILYLVDQHQSVVEQLYLASQITLNLFAILQATILTGFTGSYYGLMYFHLFLALCIDMYYNYNERGCLIFTKPKKVII